MEQLRVWPVINEVVYDRASNHSASPVLRQNQPPFGELNLRNIGHGLALSECTDRPHVQVVTMLHNRKVQFIQCLAAGERRAFRYDEIAAINARRSNSPKVRQTFVQLGPPLTYGEMPV